MQQLGQVAHPNRERGKKAGEERARVEKVVETLATLRSPEENLSAVAHDARNMVTALGLYCDLLDEPGVLAAPYAHYGSELRLVAAASRRLVEKLVALDTNLDTNLDANLDPNLDTNLDANLDANLGTQARLIDPLAATFAAGTGPVDASAQRQPDARSGRRFDQQLHRQLDLLPPTPVDNLAAELLANRNLLSALAGPSIALTVDTSGGAVPVRITGEDLTRVLVNLVKNAAEAMPAGGRIHITLSEPPVPGDSAGCVVLTVEDNGPGIANQALQAVFASGYTTRGKEERGTCHWPSLHRGLGLAITRSIVEAAGGHITARNRQAGGACFEIKVPVRDAVNREQKNRAPGNKGKRQRSAVRPLSCEIQATGSRREADH